MQKLDGILDLHFYSVTIIPLRASTIFAVVILQSLTKPLSLSKNHYMSSKVVMVEAMRKITTVDVKLHIIRQRRESITPIVDSAKLDSVLSLQ